ncbi:hypothetical protein POTOM_011222 [Populus tomentosa]|uniref:Uncharacterized protein n=1 Tax=Populus tomentosa TaxID=118781 RepID=A0A8X8ABW9_POPTO|nr:hypothetical protein POTOM_011222 [Populus tomentosa]
MIRHANPCWNLSCSATLPFGASSDSNVFPATVILEGVQGLPHHDRDNGVAMQDRRDLGTTHLSCMPVFSSDDITSYLRIALNSCLAEYASIVPE